eukprot:UN28022
MISPRVLHISASDDLISCSHDFGVRLNSPTNKIRTVTFNPGQSTSVATNLCFEFWRLLKILVSL